MSRRQPQARCPSCLLHHAYCMCASWTPLATRTRVIVFSHYRDARKPTNTARLAPRLLTRATVTLVNELVGRDRKSVV